MKITWIGHACFKIEKDDYTIVIDPYEDGYVPGLTPVRESANMVLCSHSHGDHCASDIIEQKLSESSPIKVTAINTYHDDKQGALRGLNTIHIIDDGSQRIAHLGDIGCELEPEQLEQFQNLDAVMIPVGGFYTIDASQAAAMVRRMNPRIVIPMHYRDDEAGFGYDVIGTVEEFTKRMDSVLVSQTSEVETEEKHEAQVIVLKAQNGK